MLYELQKDQTEFLIKLLRDMNFQGNLEQREIFNIKCKEIIKSLSTPIEDKK